MERISEIKSLEISPLYTALYISPIVWKGDPVGHIGRNDVFFFVLDGECYLDIDSDVHIIRKGELAFLPRGKHRRYTQTSESFAMYEMAFSATANGHNLMEALGYSSENFVVEANRPDELKRLFESSAHIELQRDPLYDLAAASNTLNVIRMYCEARAKLDCNERIAFLPITKYMSEHLSDDISLAELAAVACSSPTYFIRKFHRAFGVSPISYLNRLRIYKAMSYLSSSDMQVEDVAAAVGIKEPSYFSRVFKNHVGATPTEYKLAFRK